jgi:hypothetical protein
MQVEAKVQARTFESLRATLITKEKQVAMLSQLLLPLLLAYSYWTILWSISSLLLISSLEHACELQD